MQVSRRHLRSVALTPLILAVALAVLAACGGTALPEGTPQAGASSSDGSDLVLFARPRLIAAAGLAEPGPAPFPVALSVQPYAFGEDLLVDLSAGRHADVVEVCSNETAERLARQGLLQPLDTSRIAQWDRLYPVLKDLPGVIVDGKVYMVPLTASVTGIVYDPAETAQPPDSFGDLFAARYKGRLGFADDAALAFQIAALDLGLPDPEVLTADQVVAAKAHLRHYEDHFSSFWHDLDNLASAFRTGHVAIAVGDRRTASELERRGVAVDFALAEEGQPLAACGLAITAQARDLDAAYALIEYCLRPTTQALLATTSGEVPANREAAALMGPADRARLGLADLERLSRPVARAAELEHIDWIQAWYAVKKGRG